MMKINTNFIRLVKKKNEKMKKVKGRGPKKSFDFNAPSIQQFFPLFSPFWREKFLWVWEEKYRPHTVLFSLHFEPNKYFLSHFFLLIFFPFSPKQTCTHEYLRPIWNNKNFIHVNTKLYFNTRKSIENNRILILCLSLRVCIHMNKSFCVFFFFYTQNSTSHENIFSSYTNLKYNSYELWYFS